MPPNKLPITATTSQSRFHTDAQSSTSHTIRIRDLTLSIGQKELLAHAALNLKANGHYVLHGRNGTGKSTILQALAEHRISGVPRSVRILWLAQGAGDELGKEGRVLDRVVRSDERRERAVKEQRVLAVALENSNDAQAVVRTMRTLKLADAEGEADEAADIATFRSGARGKRARQELIDVEEKRAVAEARAREVDEELGPEGVQAATTEAVDRLREVEAMLGEMDADDAEARARVILRGLGFKTEWIEGEYNVLSGGWRTRCLLACVLFQSCDVLLLDECTNFLDLPAIIWLQGYIQRLENRTVVTVTHDREFADAVADELIVLRDQSLEYFHGNLSAYEGECRKYAKWMTRMQESQEKAKKHMEATIAGNIRAAKQKGDDKKLKQAASRQKKLDDRMGMQVSAKGGRFKKNRDLAGFHLKSRADIEVPKMDPPVKMSLPCVPPELKSTGSLVNLENVSFAYPKSRAKTLIDVSLLIHQQDRAGIVGLNGAGKSTLLKLILGDSTPGGLKPTGGKIEQSPRARVGYFSQHCVEELERKLQGDPELTALRGIMSVADGALTEQQARVALGNVGLSGQVVSNVPVGALSGGQKIRVALVRLLVPHPPHLLILDEVTSHLDADTVTALAESLRAYQGALLVVTHDRYFMRIVVEGEREEDTDSESEGDDHDSVIGTPGRVYRVTKGRLRKLEGGMSEYEGICESLAEKVARKT